MTTLHEAIASSWALVDLTSACWQGVKLDRSATRDLAVQHAADTRAVRASKTLICAARREIAAIQKIQSEARRYLDNVSVSWARGTRAVPASQLLSVLQAFSKYSADLQAAVGVLQSVWNQRVQESVQQLGTLAPALSAYPPDIYVPSMYSMHLSVVPMPQSADLSKLPLPNDTAAALIAQCEAEQQQQAASMRADLIERAKQAAQHVHDKLAAKLNGDKSRLHESALAECAVAADMLAAIDTDGMLAAIIADLRQLGSQSAEALRHVHGAQQAARALAESVASAL